MDLTTITASIGSIKTLVSIAQSLVGMNKDAAVNAKAIELLSAVTDVQSKLLEAQQSMFLMQQELMAAKEELAQKADFDRYELFEPYQGTRLYRLKESEKIGSEPIHYICPNCKDVFGNRSVLQESGYFASCPNKDCNQSYQISSMPSMNRQYRGPY